MYGPVRAGVEWKNGVESTSRDSQETAGWKTGARSHIGAAPVAGGQARERPRRPKQPSGGQAASNPWRPKQPSCGQSASDPPGGPALGAPRGKVPPNPMYGPVRADAEWKNGVESTSRNRQDTAGWKTGARSHIGAAPAAGGQPASDPPPAKATLRRPAANPGSAWTVSDPAGYRAP